MGATLFLYSLLAIAILSFISGVFILFGLGWTFIAFAFSMLGLFLFFITGVNINE